MSPDAKNNNTLKPPTARVFFALWPPKEIADRLGEVARDVANAVGGRPSRHETIHLTLAFLGDVAISKIPELCALGREIDARQFALQVDRLGYWSHNHLVWAGCTDMPRGLTDLQQRLQAKLYETAFLPETHERTFTPHLTLVRRVRRALDANPILTSGFLERFPGLANALCSFALS